MKYLVSFCVAVSSVCFINISHAQGDWYAEVAGSFGGDTTAEVEVETFGGDIEDASVKAGEGIGFAIGARLGMNETVDLVLSAGYKTGGVFAADGDSASFNRFPLNAMVNVNFTTMSLGVGFTQEVDGELDLKDVGLGKVNVDNAFGKFIELNWKISSFFRLGGRYTFIDYELEDFSNEYDGNNLAVVASFTF